MPWVRCLLLSVSFTVVCLPEAQGAPPVRRLGDVNITANRAERDVLDVAGNVTVIERDEIERSGVTHVAELLRREAGIFVTNNTTNPEGYAVEARGFNNGGGNGSSLLVLVDGRRINEPDGSTPDWSRLPLDRIERVEIARGPASAVYGDNAVAGVVNLITRRGEGAPRADLHARTGTFDLDSGSLFVGGSAGRVQASAFAEGYSEDGFRERSDYRRRAFDGTLRVQVSERIAAEIGGGYVSDNRKRPGAITQAVIDAGGRDAADPSNDANREDSIARNLQARLEVALAENLLLTVSPFFTKRDVEGSTASASFAFETDTHTKTRGLNVQVQLDRPVGDRRNRLLIGGDWLRERAERESAFNGFPAESRLRRRLYGIYLQEELNLTPDLLLSAGVRFDHARYTSRDLLADLDFHETFDLWSPKAGVTYRLAQGASVYASFARGFRFPNFDEATNFLGLNPGIDPERSQSYEVGFKVRRERWSANLAVYRMDVRDEILFNSEVMDPFPRNTNFDRVRHRGIEISLAGSPHDRLELYGSYTFDDTRFRHDSLTDLDPHRVPITPRHRGTLGASVELPRAFEIGVNANFVGRRFVANDLENEFEELSKHATYDVVARWGRRLGERLRVQLTAAVRNVFDREYSEVAGERTFVPGEIAFFPAPGRHYELGVRIEAAP